MSFFNFDEGDKAEPSWPDLGAEIERSLARFGYGGRKLFVNRYSRGHQQHVEQVILSNDVDPEFFSAQRGPASSIFVKTIGTVEAREFTDVDSAVAFMGSFACLAAGRNAGADLKAKVAAAQQRHSAS